MAPGLVDDFKDGCADVLIPPGLPYLAREFPLKILPYLTNLRLNGMRHAHLLLLVEGEKDKLWSLLCRLNIEGAVVENLRHLRIHHQHHSTLIVECLIPRMGIVQLGRQCIPFEHEPNRGLFWGVGVIEHRCQISPSSFGHYKHHTL